MKIGDISDIASGVVAIPFLCYYIYVMRLTRQNKELEFNRMWRTRYLIVTLALIFALLYPIGNFRCLGEKIQEESADSICSIFSLFQFSFAENLFLFSIIAIMKLAASVVALDTHNPNKAVIRKMIFPSLPGFIVGLVVLICSILFKPTVVVSSYDKDDSVCYTSNLTSTYSFVISLAILIFLVHTRRRMSKEDKSPYSILNRTHKEMVRKLVYWMIFFVLGSLVSEFVPFFDDKFRWIFQIVTEILLNCGFTAFVYYLVQRPIKESLEVPLLRGSITLRHDHYLNELSEENEQKDAQNEGNSEPQDIERAGQLV